MALQILFFVIDSLFSNLNKFENIVWSRSTMLPLKSFWALLLFYKLYLLTLSLIFGSDFSWIVSLKIYWPMVCLLPCIVCILFTESLALLRYVSESNCFIFLSEFILLLIYSYMCIFGRLKFINYFELKLFLLLSLNCFSSP